MKTLKEDNVFSSFNHIDGFGTLKQIVDEAAIRNAGVMVYG